MEMARAMIAGLAYAGVQCRGEESREVVRYFYRAGDNGKRHKAKRY
jgi:hypothetical protein